MKTKSIFHSLDADSFAIQRISRGLPVQIVFDESDRDIVAGCSNITILKSSRDPDFVVYGKTGKSLPRLLLGATSGQRIVYKSSNRLDLRRSNISVAPWHSKASLQLGRTGIGPGRPGTGPVPGSGLMWTRSSRGGVLKCTAIRAVHRGSERSTRDFAISIYGLDGAIWRALAWQVEKAVQEGKAPASDLLRMVAEYAKKARIETVRVPMVQRDATRLRVATAGHKNAASLHSIGFSQRPTRTITDLPDGSIALEHYNSKGNDPQTILLNCTDLHAYDLYSWRVDKGGILVSGKNRNEIRLHRVLAGAAPGDRVVFRNGNTLDLRRENLVIDGVCINRCGRQSPSIRPLYKGRGSTRIEYGVRVTSHKVRRDFYFSQDGEQGARRRAYKFRIQSLKDAGRAVDPELTAELERLTVTTDQACGPVTSQTANFFQMFSVGGALSK